MKSLIQGVWGRFGYGFRKLSLLNPFVPFVRDLNFPGASFQMWIANRDDVEWYAQEHWLQCGELYALQKLASKGDRVLEIGSHHGFTALLLSNFVGPNGSVYSLEAHPHNAMITQAQLGLNRFINNLQFFNYAASQTPGVVRINPSHNSNVTANLENTIEVKAITGDEMDQKYGPFDLIKIDVEGYELEVLKGCKKLLSRLPKIALEIHRDGIRQWGHNVSNLWDLLDLNRYEGEMVLRPEKYREVVPFNPSLISQYEATNVFLRPRK
jgi:FkbM family methyltransferase